MIANVRLRIRSYEEKKKVRLLIHPAHSIVLLTVVKFQTFKIITTSTINFTIIGKVRCIENSMGNSQYGMFWNNFRENILTEISAVFYVKPLMAKVKTILTLFNGQANGGSADANKSNQMWFFSDSFGHISFIAHVWKYSQLTPSGLQRRMTTTHCKKNNSKVLSVYSIKEWAQTLVLIPVKQRFLN